MIGHSNILIVVVFAIMAMLVSSPAGAEPGPVEFNRDIRPILSAKCFQCHGPDENSREADLRLDIAGDPHGPFSREDGAVINPGDVEDSELWRRVSADDEDTMMPPPASHKKPLTDPERQLVKAWIEQGAKYQPFWAFIPAKPQEPPVVEDAAWNVNRIDRFVRKRLAQIERTPKENTDKRTLIRRVTLDLTGLPPTPEEIALFLQDHSPDAYEKLVDRLMATPQYGEHMARYWLDLVRFADTNGIHHDHYREMTPYRDWVIRAFNSNLPFDDFVRYQLAGDLYEDPTTDQLIASGFNRLHLVIDVGTALPEESFVRNVVDRVNAVGTAFLGLTVGCAVCHDHKYDPITQRDYYRLFAFFNNIDATPETPGARVHHPSIRLPSDQQQLELDRFVEAIANTKETLSSLKEQSATKEQIEAAEKAVKAAQKKHDDFESTLPVSLVMKERAEIRPAHILRRGAYDQPGDEVQRGTPDFLPPLISAGETKTRMDLANWLVDAQHPLTARVTVNRIWQQFFGVGIVRTSEDFGMQGEWPSHPALLDDLAVTFIQSGWNVKELVKSIVTSETYKQTSKASLEEYRSDPANRLLARGSRFRLDAEVVRDQFLATSGLLNREMYGKSVKPPQPPDLWKSVSMVSSSTYAFKADEGDKIYRRSVYTFWKRALPPPQMTIFDAPTREACIARRERTNTPLQALVLMNEPEYFKATVHLAQRVLDVPEERRLQHIFELLTARELNEREAEVLANALDGFRAMYKSDLAAAERLTAELPDASDERCVELAAHAMLINSIYNLDITKTRN
ncbi:MAG: PSD1 domain-containing protein [Planctomycetales bacterium]|nr:PSD1 domain-containing protein [Planctomycetales bacterium]